MSVPKRRLKTKPKKNLQRFKHDRKKIQTINKKVNHFFDRANLDKSAKRTGFLIRNSVITPFIFVYALSMGLFGIEISLNMLAIDMNQIFGTHLTGSAFSYRMHCKNSVLFLKASFEQFLNLQLESAFENGFNKVFSKIFKSVILEDSTVIELNEKVAKNFKGSGGAASKSSVKLNWVFNICLYAAVAVDISSGSTTDRKNAKKSIKHVKKGTLLIRDLGYFVTDVLRAINEKKAYYLSRVRKGTLLYLNRDDPKPLDIESFFKKLTARSLSVTIPIFLGKEERFSTSLILQKVPNWVLKQRIGQFKKKNSGKSPSDEFIAWAKYSVFITNIPEELLLSYNESFSELIIFIYKTRWQIELIFKKLKSNIKLNVIKCKNENRILCLIYGRLIAILLGLMILSYAASKNYQGREISLWKVTAWLVNGGRLAKAILKKTFFKLYTELCGEFKLLCKDKRNRKTALEQLADVLPWEKLAA
jgi:hypothetical protein